jgi:hypothetical protein
MSSTDGNQLVSAQVVLRSANGGSPDPNVNITSANIREFLPAPEAVTQAQQAFVSASFEVGPVVGNSFSIMAPVTTFEQTFGVRLSRGRDSSIQVAGTDGTRSLELPLGKLPAPLSRLIAAVTFTPRPHFGPSNFAS